jgi:hypothetical protein
VGTFVNIGDNFTLFKEKHNGYGDGCYFEALEDNGGFIMPIYLANMAIQEKMIMSSERINARLIREWNYLLVLIQFGNSPLIFEISFDPTLYQDKRAMQIAFNNHMVHFIGIERTTNEVQLLRVSNVPMKLKQAFITAWTNAFEEENYSVKFANWIHSLYKYSILELWEMGVDVGYFGEKGMFE